MPLQVITKHPRHNKMLITCEFRLERSGQYNFHQDGRLPAGLNVEENPPFEWKHPANLNLLPGNTPRYVDVAMFAYKKPKDGPILPTTIAQMTTPPPLRNKKTFFKEELVKMLEKGTVSCPAVDEGDVIVVNNLTALHATTSPDMAEALLGEGREKDYFESSNPPVMNEGTLNAPFFRVLGTTFYAP